MFQDRISESDVHIVVSSVLPAEHAFSTRLGGVSTGGFESFNVGSARGDDPDAVRENYRRWCAVFGAGMNECCVTNQVHGNAVRIVTSADRHKCLEKTPYEADGIVTAEKNLPIFCFTADCVPVLLCDKHGKAAGAVHCGWRSSAADILGATVKAMEELGAEAEEIYAAIGPSIGKCCFETDRDVPDALSAFLGGDTEGLWTVREDGKYLVDLRGANARRLVQLGLRPEHIDISEECTVCSHEKYWSARYTKRHHLKRGSMVAGIVLR